MQPYLPQIKDRCRAILATLPRDAPADSQSLQLLRALQALAEVLSLSRAAMPANACAVLRYAIAGAH
jgi:hypothetical protein